MCDAHSSSGGPSDDFDMSIAQALAIAGFMHEHHDSRVSNGAWAISNLIERAKQLGDAAFEAAQKTS